MSLLRSFELARDWRSTPCNCPLLPDLFRFEVVNKYKSTTVPASGRQRYHKIRAQIFVLLGFGLLRSLLLATSPFREGLASCDRTLSPMATFLFNPFAIHRLR